MPLDSPKITGTARGGWAFAAVLLFLGLLAGCAHIRLNSAMERAQVQRDDLFYAVETAPPKEVRRIARGLAETLAEPAIAEYSLDDDYQHFLADTGEVVSLIYKEATASERDVLLALRSRLGASCQSCHDRYRR